MQLSSRRLRHLIIPVVAMPASVATAFSVALAPAADRGGADPAVVSPTTSLALRPHFDRPPAPELSPSERDRAIARVRASREAVESRYESPSGTHPGEARDRSPEVEIARGGESRAVSRSTFIRRNNRNTRASSVSSLLAEPAAANDASQVLYLGNTYASRSLDNGATWSADSIPSGPSFAQFVCCDPDVVHHGPLDTTYSTWLYRNSTGLNGAITIEVRRSTISGGTDCLYDYNPPGSTTVPDYPHIARTSKWIYLTVNNLNTKGTSTGNDDTWIGSQVVRFNASQMSNCQTADTEVFTHVGTRGQRIFVPVENAGTFMFWGALDDSNTFRIFRWTDTGTSVSQFTRDLPHSSTFGNPDCRGGTGNLDWIGTTSAPGIGGFDLKGASVPNDRIRFVWPVAADSSHTQMHIHSAIFRASDLALLPSPSIISSSNCIGFPVLGANSKGFFGLSVALGGRSGGGGSAAQGYVAVDDASTTGNRFQVLTRTATGTHNPTNARFGDYFSVRRSDRCSLAWVATNYALLNGNTSSAHVNARYVEFGSDADQSCF